MLVSPVIGPWSDSFQTPMGRRKPFLLAALGPMGFCLLLMPFMPNLWTTCMIVLAFFFAYYVYEPPYRGLYPDLVPAAYLGRAQGVQHVFRGTALLLALVGGGFLLKVWSASPFVLAAVITTAACGAVIVLVEEERGQQRRVFEGVRRYLSHSWQLLRREPEIRRFLAANAAWEGTFAAARTFVVLYVIQGLGESKAISSAILAGVGAGYVLAALVAGRLGDRFGLARVIFFASFVYGGGFLVAGPGPEVARVVLRADRARRVRGWHRHDPGLGIALQADAARAPRSRFRARDHDQGHRPALRGAAGGAGDRPCAAVSPGDARVPGALAPVRSRGAGGDPARRLVDPRRA